MDRRKMDVRVGFVGLGNQGLPMAQRIAAAGWPLTVWARRPASLDPVRESATVAADLESMAGECDVIGICVADDDDVGEVVAALRPGLTKGTVLLIHSTVLPATCRALDGGLAPLGAAVLDAPVTGGAQGAARGRLAVAIGGPRDLFEAVEPVVRSYGDPVVHAGPVGSGQVVKLLTNLLFCARSELLGKITDAGLALGLERDALAAFLAHDTTSSFAARLAAGTITPASASHARRMLSKDVGHAVTVLAESADAAAGIGLSDARLLADALLARLDTISVGSDPVRRPDD